MIATLLHNLGAWVAYSLPVIIGWEAAKALSRWLGHRRALLLGMAGVLVMAAFGVRAAPAAHADPICNAPGLPACAGPAPFTLTPEQQCAVIAWRTWIPCNWWGAQVPQGTPGSVG